MRKLLSLFFLTCGLTALAADANLNGSVESLNQAVKAVLAPFQNSTTQAELVFDNVETDDQRALSLQLKGFFKKIGAFNSIEVRLDNLSYSYGDGKLPLTTANVYLSTDWTKILPAEDLNTFVPTVEEIVVAFAKDAMRDYGDAAIVDAKVLRKEKDANGNYVAIDALFEFKVNLDKLPASKKKEDILFLTAKAEVSLDLNKGLGLNLALGSNIHYRGFQDNQVGLKQELEKLLRRDPVLLEQIVRSFRQLEETSNNLLNR